jgi:hypothetical protein
MKVWCFKSGGELWALTDEGDGSKLPTHLGPWNLHLEVDLSGDSADEREAIRLIELHGFCCFRSEARASA